MTLQEGCVEADKWKMYTSFLKAHLHFQEHLKCTIKVCALVHMSVLVRVYFSVLNLPS